MTEYYPVNFFINNKAQYCIWYTNDEDGFLINNTSILCFDEIEQLYEYCKVQNINISGEVTSYNLDKVKLILKSSLCSIDYKLFLEIWNLCSDLANSVSIEFYGDNDGLTLDVYNLLFYGNNPSAMKDENEDFVPEWDEEDVDELKIVLQQCISMIENYVIKS